MAARRRPLWPLLAELGAFVLIWEALAQLLPTEGWWRRSLLRPESRSWYAIESPRELTLLALALLVVYPLLRIWRGRWTARDFGLRRDGWPEALRFGTVQLALTLLVAHLGFLLLPGMPEQLWEAYHRPAGEHAFALLAMVIPIQAAFAEEVIYRGYLQGALSRCHRAWGPFCAALLFAAPHAFQGAVPLLLFHLPGALVVAAVYRRIENIVVMIATHAVFDLIVFAVMIHVVHHPGHRVALSAGIAVGAAAVLVGLRGTVLALWHEVLSLLSGLRVRWATWISNTLLLLGLASIGQGALVALGAGGGVLDGTTVGLGLALLLLVLFVVPRAPGPRQRTVVKSASIQ